MIKNINKLVKMETLPIVTVPLIAYYETKTSKNKLIKKVTNEAITQSTNTPVTDRVKKNIEALKKAGVPENKCLKYIQSDGYMNEEGKKICQANSSTNFTGAPKDTQPYDHDMQDYNDVHSDISTSDGGFATLEPENSMEIGQMDSNLGELSESAGITEQMDQVLDVIDNPLLEGVAAELLPGTKFLKPGKDLIDGDYEKAAVGAATRLGEIAAAPVKLGWAAFGALAGTASWLAGNRGEGVGLWGGMKQASKMWAKQRNGIENAIINREEVDPNAQEAKRRDAYEAATQAEIRRLNIATDNEIRRMNSDNAEKIKQSEQERLMAKKDYDTRHSVTSKIRQEAHEKINQSQERQQLNKEYLRQLITEKEQNFRYQQKMIAKLSEDIKKAESEYNTKLAKELEKQKADLSRIFKEQAKEALSGVNYILEIAKQYEQIYKRNDAEGFASVAGYKDTKNKLAAMFGVPLIQNRKNPDIKVPNVIALYGPKGTGKTILGTSLAKQFDCTYGGSLLLKVGDDINFSRLMNIAEKAKTEFEKTGRRTIIQIDEVEFFGTKQTPSLWKRLRGKPETFADFLSICSEKYGCTLVVTTNEPDKIDDSIKSKMKFLYVPVANEDDMAEILKFHVNNRNKENINYEKLVALLMAKTKDGSAFTNARLEDIVKTVISRHGVLNQKLLEEEIAEREPDISKQEIDFYKKDFKLCK